MLNSPSYPPEKLANRVCRLDFEILGLKLFGADCKLFEMRLRERLTSTQRCFGEFPEPLIFERGDFNVGVHGFTVTAHLERTYVKQAVLDTAEAAGIMISLG